MLVGIETSDDAAVYKVSDNLAIVSTVDFFPPVVDDPYTFGEISAANALSDVYAMGGVPRFATNIVCFPRDLSKEILSDILQGSADKLKEAGVVIAGGHSIEDKEIKYGLSVTGVIDPSKIVRNSGAKPGDVLILTKPLGAGVITSAIKRGAFNEDQAKEAFDSMRRLNRDASLAMVEAGSSAATDVTGFGLLGHAFEMADAAKVSFMINSKDVRFFPGAMELVRDKKNRPRAMGSTMDFLKGCVEISPDVSEEAGLLLYDPQTSGGLLVAIAKDKAKVLMDKLSLTGVDAVIIGAVVERNEKWVIRVS